MTSYPLGQGVDLIIGPVTNDSGVVANPATLNTTITLPDGSTVAKTIADVTNVATGLFRLPYLPLQSGAFKWRAVGTVPNFAQEDGFEVSAAGADLTGPVDLGEFKDWLNLTNNTGPGGDRELVGFLNSATRLIKSYVGEILPVAVTEAHDGGQPEVALDNAVRSVTTVIESYYNTVYTITDQPYTSDPTTWTGYGYTRSGCVLTRRRGPVLWGYADAWRGRWAPGRKNIVVTYMAGIADADLPLVREAIYELATHLFKSQQGGRRGQEDWSPQMAYALPNRVREMLLPIALGPWT